MKDDRGNPIPRGAHLPVPFWKERPEIYGPDSMLIGGGRGVLLFAIVGLGLPTVVMSGVPMVVPLPWEDKWTVLLAVFGVVLLSLFVAMFIGHWLVFRFAPRAWRRRLLLPRKRCPACASALRDDADAERYLLCSECGASWAGLSSRDVYVGILGPGREALRNALGVPCRRSREFFQFQKSFALPQRLARLARHGPKLRLLALVAIFGPAVSMAAFTVHFVEQARDVIPTGAMVSLLFVFVNGFTVATLSIVMRDRYDTSAAVQAALARGHCPSCWAEIGPDELNCPECKTPWRLPSSDEG